MMARDLRRRRELLAIVTLLAGLFLGLALVPGLGLTGPAGRIVGGLLRDGLGLGAVAFPVIALLAGLSELGWLRLPPIGRLGILALGLSALVPYAIAVGSGHGPRSSYPPELALWSFTEKLIGLVPAVILAGVSSVVGTAGAVIVGLLGLSGLTIVTFDWHPFRRREPGDGSRETLARGSARDDRTPPDARERPSLASRLPSPGAEDDADPPPPLRKPVAKRKGKVAPEEALDVLPPMDLMEAPSRENIDAGEAELERLGHVLIATLRTFRVEGTIVGRTTGPVVTQYEIAPAPGVKVGRIAALADDLALAMRAQSIRIVAPIPGKAAVGVEVPNPTARIVRLRELLETSEWDRARASLPIALGRDLEGAPVIADLARMPHLLIAGATGSGKSVCINTIITSLIYRYTPRELRMLMIDPKMVELSGYNALPHLRHAVVTNNKQAAQALKWAVHEMERRYALFNANGARNLGDFNRKAADGRELVHPSSGVRVKEDGTKEPVPPEPFTEGTLPFIVVLVDELADLMMTVQGEVEKPLAMLAQKARATGIHLILATQRPSVNVITGLIKANFSSRIAFRVASKVDSRTILDQNGAEALLGNGDMLFLPPGKSEPVRLQGAFIGTEESEAITDWYADQKRQRDEALEARGLVPPDASEADILEQIALLEAEEAGPSDGGGAEGAGDRDVLFIEAAEVCLQHQQGSTSLLQRKLRIGYGRAARIIDQLHEAGILGPPDGSKPRDVLIGPGQLEEYSR